VDEEKNHRNSSPLKAGDVLVVDDNQNNLIAVSDLLNEKGYKVRGATTGKMAIDIAAHQPPELMLLDVMMPDMDGFEVCHKLKDSTDIPEFPIIFLSALTELEDQVKGFDAGAVDFITKPIRSEELFARVKTHIELHQSRIALKNHSEDLEKHVQERTVELKQANDATRKSEERLKLALEATNTGLWDYRPQSGEIYFNPQWFTMLDYEPDELPHTYETWAELLHPEDGPEAEERLRIFLENREAFYSIEFRMQMRNGDWCWILSQGKPAEWDADGNVLRLIGTHTDITEQIRSQQELREYGARLGEAESIANLGHWHLDLIKNKLEWSDGVFKIFGVEPQKFTETYEAFLEFVHPDDRELVDHAYTNSLKTREAYEITHRIVSSDGTLKFVREKCNTDFDEDGNPLRSLGIVLDITEIKTTQLELEKHQLVLEEQVKERTSELELAKERAEIANRAKSEFLSHMSHELRTPMNAILGYSQLLRREPDIPESHQNYVNIINSSGNHLLSLIDDILELSKIEAGRVEINSTVFNLRIMLDNLATGFSLRAEEKGLRLIVNCSPDVPGFIRSDEQKLRQVLTNLLSNALKFTSSGYVEVNVNSKGEDDAGNNLLFEIKDTGPGISPEEADNLFVAFEQAQAGREAGEGTGLGLAISQRFVKLLGGTISVDSKEGQGTAFSFTINVESIADDPRTTIIHRKVIRIQPGQKIFKILVVEDHKESRQMLKKLLQVVGFEVEEAVNGREGVERFKSWHPDLIFMDMRMPEMDGYETTRIIKKAGGSGAPPIIAVTASALEEDRAKILSADCDEYIRKPFQEAEIFEVIADLLGVEYLYDDFLADESLKEQIPVHNFTLTRESLAALPAVIIEELKTCSGELRQKPLLQLSRRIREDGYEAIADGLDKIAEEFQFERLIELLNS